MGAGGGGIRPQGRVEAEELGDCDADGGEGEGGAEPGEEGAFYTRNLLVNDLARLPRDIPSTAERRVAGVRTQSQVITRNTPLVLQLHAPPLLPKAAPPPCLAPFRR